MTHNLFGEATELFSKARSVARLEASQQHNDNRRTKMNYENHDQQHSSHETSTVTAHAAGELYSSGKSVLEVAQSCGITYGKARRLIRESGTPIRDASSRLKGRTRRRSVD